MILLVIIMEKLRIPKILLIGTNAMIPIFSDFRQFSAKQLSFFFLKTNSMVLFSA
jgi:hypothetical protein